MRLPLPTLLLLLSAAARCLAADSPDVLLDDLYSRSFHWFQDHRHPQTGQVADHSDNLQTPDQPFHRSSIAATGYLLTLLPQWSAEGLLPPHEAQRQALQALDFALTRIEHHRGLLYHFIDPRTGARSPRSEASLLDTAIFLNGSMVAAQAFGGDIAQRADALLDRVEWEAFLTTHPTTAKPLLALGYRPETGLCPPAQSRSSEMAMAYFLAVGSKTHPIDPACWYNTSIHWGTIEGHRILNPSHSLFTSYYGLGWHDLKDKLDRDGIDLYENARLAALANRAACRNRAPQQRTYAFDQGGWWGISAGQSPRGYVAPGPLHGDPDAVVWPITSLAAITWIPREIHEDLPRWRSSTAWSTASGPYGLVAFSLQPPWTGQHIFSIDLGSFAVNLTNHRHHAIWDLWMRHPLARSAFHRLQIHTREKTSPGHPSNAK